MASSIKERTDMLKMGINLHRNLLTVSQVPLQESLISGIHICAIILINKIDNNKTPTCHRWTRIFEKYGASILTTILIR